MKIVLEMEHELEAPDGTDVDELAESLNAYMEHLRSAGAPIALNQDGEEVKVTRWTIVRLEEAK